MLPAEVPSWLKHSWPVAQVFLHGVHVSVVAVTAAVPVEVVAAQVVAELSTAVTAAVYTQAPPPVAVVAAQVVAELATAATPKVTPSQAVSVPPPVLVQSSATAVVYTQAPPPLPVAA